MNVPEEVYGIVGRELGRAKSEFDGCTTLEDLGADSLDRIELCIEMEKHFQIDISDEDLEKHFTTTVGQIVLFVQGKVNGHAL